MTNSEKGFIEKLNQLIEDNLENPTFSTDIICLELGVSRSQLHRILIEDVQLSTTLYIRKKRLEKAKELLSTTQMRISEVGDAVGFINPSNFSKYFFDEFNISPSDYKKLSEVNALAEKQYTYGLSIAVLPFVNMSNDIEQEYFSDGITEEIINVLAQVPSLKVAGRTSSFSFKNKNTDLRKIGSLLNVNHILEGSVRKSGNKLRITAQLIKVEDGFHLWSEKFDREINDIFDIQDEISLAILKEIKIKLLGEEKEVLLKRDTNNTEAYQLYLKGRFYYNKLSSTESFFKAIQYFEEAIALEPDYAAAYSGMAACYLQLWFFSQLLPDKNFEKTKFAIQKAFELDPNNADNYVRDGHLKMWYDWNFNGAEISFKKALAINPNNIELHHYLGFFYNYMEKYDLANLHFEKCLALDPLSMLYQLSMCWNYWWQGEFDLGVEFSQKIIDFKPYFWGGYHTKALFLFEKMQFEDIIYYLDKSIEFYPSSLTIVLKGIVLVFMGKTDNAKELLAELETNIDKYPVSNHDLGQLCIALGDLDKAHHYWTKALEMHEGRMLFIHKFFRKAKFFKSHPQFEHFFKAIENVLMKK